jgi:hypothetical protein
VTGRAERDRFHKKPVLALARFLFWMSPQTGKLYDNECQVDKPGNREECSVQDLVE